MNKSASIVAQTVSNFGFSAKPVTELTATEYTLADIELDLSPSTAPYVALLEKALNTVRDSLDKSPRAENMLVRVQTFDEHLKEAHGFVALKDIKAGDYSLASVGSGTALYDAALSGVEAVEAEGARLDSLDYGVNGVVIIITDGEENSSRVCRSPQKVKNAIQRIAQAEKLESIKTILVGVGRPDADSPDDPDNATKAYLEDFKDKAGIDQYVWAGRATAGNIAKIANFVSRSVSSSSQSLGTGGPSQSLSF